MTVHIFGATDSPCSANSILLRTADDNEESFDPSTIDTLRQNFYVDDLLNLYLHRKTQSRLWSN